MKLKSKPKTLKKIKNRSENIFRPQKLTYNEKKLDSKHKILKEWVLIV